MYSVLSVILLIFVTSDLFFFFLPSALLSLNVIPTLSHTMAADMSYHNVSTGSALSLSHQLHSVLKNIILHFKSLDFFK